ncbi:GNAT family N-acetyltransferase [Streptomyces sp. NPDC048172]|uniref:GNAT family N-acetyltransferase n=1 Tax=Streptomyces sp. NPDC048172 TaxID=3365505 RepID=UPI00372119A2
MDREIVRAWVEGWVVSRGASPPVEEEWGFYYDIGPFHKAARYVLAEPDEARVRELTGSIAGSGVWLAVFEEPEVVREWIAPGWTIGDPGYLMTTTFAAADTTAVPEGYEVRLWERGGVVRVVVRAPDGGPAARGQIGLPGGGRTAVVDQIETVEAHQRRGLGRLVMGVLGNAALEAGVQDAVLAATDDGRALYTALGWRVVSPQTDLFRTAEDAAADGVTAAEAASSVAERAVGAARVA